MIRNTHFAPLGLLVLPLAPGVYGEESAEDLAGIIAGSAIALILLVVGLIFLLFFCYHRSQNEKPITVKKRPPRHVANGNFRKHVKPYLNGLPPPHKTRSLGPERRKYRPPRPQYSTNRSRAPKRQHDTELAVFRPQSMQPYIIRPMPQQRYIPATMQPYYVTPEMHRPVIYVQNGTHPTRQSMHVATQAVYVDQDASKLHIQEIESVEGQMHLSDEEQDNHIEVPHRPHHSRSRSPARIMPEAMHQFEEGDCRPNRFEPSVDAVAGDITFLTSEATRRPSTGESPQPPDYTYAQVIKKHSFGEIVDSQVSTAEQQSNLRQTWHPEGIVTQTSHLSKTWHQNLSDPVTQSDLRATMSEKIEQIVESGKKGRPSGIDINEEIQDITSYPTRQSIKTTDQSRSFLSATQPASRPPYETQDHAYSNFISRSQRSPSPKRWSPASVRRSGSTYRRSPSPNRRSPPTARLNSNGPNRLSKPTVDPTNGEHTSYSEAFRRLTASQKGGQAPFAYVPVAEIHKRRQRTISSDSKTDTDSLSGKQVNFSRQDPEIIPRQQRSGRWETHDDEGSGVPPLDLNYIHSGGIPPPPPLPT